VSRAAARNQRGAALLAAMLTVALVASLAATSLWQQWRNVEVESAERARVQAQWVLAGALDWARLILREDARSGGADHLAEPWAVPLQEARLSTFLATDKSSPVDSDTMTQTFLSGGISDLQGRLNVRNLVDAGKVSAPALHAFSKLFEKLKLPNAELVALAENLRFALDASPENGSSALAPLVPQRVSQLGWLGLSPATLAVLLPYITLLPVATPVNLNTADAMVLYASIPLADMAMAQRLVSVRQASHFRALSDAAKFLGEPANQLVDAQHSVNSRFFEVYGRLRQEDAIVEQRSVLQRDATEVKTLWKDGGPQWVPGYPLK
jgi:general secretion pathway protein K